MGCNFSNEPVRIVEAQKSISSDKPEPDISECDKQSSITKSDESFVSSNGSIESDRLTAYSVSGVLASRRTKSIDLRSRNDFLGKSETPVAKATIIRGPSAPSSASIHNIPDITLTNQSENATSYSSITIAPQSSPSSKIDRLNRRRSSDGDVGKVTSVTCIPPSVLKSNPHLRSLSEMKVKPPQFGPRNSHLTLTESQKDFFRMLDEKVNQGKDYCSEDERSLASFRSVNRKDSNGSGGFFPGHIPQHVR